MRPSLALFLLGAWLARAEPAPAPVLSKVEVVEKLGERLPGELTFTDWRGEKVKLSSLHQGERPVLLTLVYYRCPTLCGLVLNGMVSALKRTGLEVGRDVSVVTVSIDPEETPELARKKRAVELASLGLTEEAQGWSFLVGEEAAVAELAEAVGFRYGYDEEIKQFAHAAVLMVLTPDGRVSRYIYGVTYPPRDLKLALLEASGGRVGTAFDRFLLTCYRYDPATRRYEPYVQGFIRGGALLVFFALAATLAVFWRRELRHGSGRKPTEPP